MDIEFVEKLSLDQQFQLIVIAHETKDFEIKNAALAILKNCTYPPITGAFQHDANSKEV